MDNKNASALVVIVGAAITLTAAEIVKSRRRLRKIHAEIDARTEHEIRAIKKGGVKTSEAIARGEVRSLVQLIERQEFETIIAFNEN